MMLRLLLLLVAGASSALAPPPQAQAWNAFVARAEAWTELYNSHPHPSQTLNASELRAWQAVKTSWGEARKAIDAEY